VRRRDLLLACALCFAAAASRAEAPALRAGVFEPPREAPAFVLQGSDGAELTLARFRGRVVLLAFGFTSCADVCPITLSVLARARAALGAEADGVQVVYVTVDPERDDAARMREYLAHFDASFVGGTGSTAQLAALREQYGIAAKRVASGASYAVAHSSFVYLIDRSGRLRALMPFGHEPEDYVHDLRVLLAP
jgi:protein SCO1/2